MVNEKKKCDLMVCGKVLTMDRDRRVIDQGAVAVIGDRIVAVGDRFEIADLYQPYQVLERQNGLVMPGLVNVHTHAPMAILRGVADDLPLMTWLQDHIFPVEARLTSEAVYYGALLSMVEMIKTGTTSFCDMYLFAADVARAATAIGMRGWVGEAVFDFPSPNYGEVANAFSCIDALFDAYSDDSLITPTVDPHAVYTCSPDLLVKLKTMAVDQGTSLVIHLSETRDEVALVNESFGMSPVKHMDALGILDDGVLAAHCVVLSEDEIELLASRGGRVAHCPESNMKLASGVAPVPDLLAAGVRVGLGTDGSASNNDVDMFGEMDMAAKIHKVDRLDPTVMSAGQTLNMATMGGASALAAEDDIGSLAPGRKADMIVIDLDQPHLTPLYNLSSHLVYAARGSDVVDSVINGRVVMADRRLTMVDEDEVMARVRQLAVSLTG